MRNVLVGLVLAATCSLTACAGAAQQVEVKGGNADLVSLAGEWEGQYEGTDSGRNGTIKFSLEVGRHTADGQVFLSGNTPLAISFVEVDQGQISGRIDTYVDPACNCKVRTEFLGLLKGDVVDGTFTSMMLENGQQLRGNWSVVRKGA
jgi:hypothetical protein